MKAQPLIDVENVLGECACWSPREQAFWWVDIEAQRLHRFVLGTSCLDQWPMPEKIAAVAVCEDPRYMLVGLASRLAFFEKSSARLLPICAVDAGAPTRVNDCTLDRSGQFVFGTQDEGAPQGSRGAYFRLRADLRLERLSLPAAHITNALSVSPDGATLYFTDTPTRVVRCCAYRADADVGPVRDFVHLGNAPGNPDGATVDAEGGVWNAHYGAGQVVRYDAHGRETLPIEVDAQNVTCVAFGGETLDTLFITTARQGMDAQALQSQPAAGRVFTACPGVRGLADTPFRGVPA